MLPGLNLFVLFETLARIPLSFFGGGLSSWEGSHIDVSTDNRAVDWWYTQVVSQTPAPNGIAPSIEVLLSLGNAFQFGTSNTPLYSVAITGFDLNGVAFAQTIAFNTSTITPTGQGLQTHGVWGNNEVNFTTNSDLTTFTMNFNTDNATGTVVMHAQNQNQLRTGCGGVQLTDSPYFESLVSDGRPLTAAETILYKETGWRITIPGGPATVDVVLNGNAIKFDGRGYKDSTWAPNPMNDFIESWYIAIAEVGPWAFVTFTGTPMNGTNNINIAHLTYNGEFLTSQCNIIGERSTDISIITPSGEVTDSGVIAPTAFDVTFVLPDSRNISFHAANIAVNPSSSFYHRWVAKYTGGEVATTANPAPQQYESYGLAEWMNPGNLPHWPIIQ